MIMYRSILIFFAITSVWPASAGSVTVNVNSPTNPFKSLINCPNICPFLCPVVCSMSPLRAVNVTDSPYESSTYGVGGLLCETACKKVCNKFFPDPEPADKSVKLTIMYNVNESYLEVIEPNLKSGKWAQYEDCDKKAPSPNLLKITKDQPARIRACGSKGVQGSLYLQSTINGVLSKDAYVKFGAGSNNLEVINLNTSNPVVLCVTDSNDNTIYCSKLKN